MDPRWEGVGRTRFLFSSCERRPECRDDEIERRSASVSGRPIWKSHHFVIAIRERELDLRGGIIVYYEFLPKLQPLVLTNNRLTNLVEIDPLASVSKLQFLSLLDNITKKPNYRLYVINKLKSLRDLDFRKVKQKISGYCGAILFIIFVKILFVASFFFDRAAEAGFVDPNLAVAKVHPGDFKVAAKRAYETRLEDVKSIYPRVKSDKLPFLCMDLVYQFTLLVDGFGEVDPWQEITLVKKVLYQNSLVEAAWPLGSAIEAVSSPP
ncbi:hypothetical protein CASFOL_000487 [Castilleja foliolosa]|uniref:Apyrase n=1 Tax=Castilleja foliolosa TaxID=1961234 RepID=A0ABD3EPE5_9LAMI